MTQFKVGDRIKYREYTNDASQNAQGTVLRIFEEDDMINYLVEPDEGFSYWDTKESDKVTKGLRGWWITEGNKPELL